MSKANTGNSRATPRGSGGWPSTNHNPSGGGRHNAPPAPAKK